MDILAQRFSCYEEGQIVHSGPMSSGTSCDEQGEPRDIYDLEYVVVKKKIDAYSEMYHVPMPYSVMLGDAPGNMAGRKGLIIHYGQLPGYPDSHDCFRLGLADAKWVFNWAKVGLPIYVINARRP